MGIQMAKKDDVPGIIAVAKEVQSLLIRLRLAYQDKKEQIQKNLKIKGVKTP